VANDLEAVDAAGKALEARLKGEAKKIHEKYVEVPLTTEFAVLFLPSEALYAECLRRPGLAQFVQNTYRVTIAGPTVLASLLNSLQMGFRTLAIQKRSAEVWEILGKVKGEFEKFTKVIDQIDKQVETVKNSIASVRTRTNVMSRNLRNVESLPGDENSITMLIDNKGE
jgi:DNA recombination protein RmuC